MIAHRGRRRLPIALDAPRSAKAKVREQARQAERARITSRYDGPLPKLNALRVREAIARRLRGEADDASA